MAVSQITVCDCCNEQINSSSVLDAVIVTYLQDTGEVMQAHFGLACGCGVGVREAALTGDHGPHATPEAPAPEPTPEPTPAP